MSPRQPPDKRKRIIKKHIVSKDIDEIAQICGVNEKTIDRDISKMKKSGEWHEWLELFLLRLYSSDDVSDDAKLRSVTTLYARTITQKTEIEATGEIPFILQAWRPEKDNPDADG